MSDSTIPTSSQLPAIRIDVSQDGHTAISYRATDILAPANLAERLEWVRKSYEHFFEKVLENEALVGAIVPDFCSEI